MRIGSILENQNIEKRIAITPEIVKKYTSIGCEILLIQNYGIHLGIDDKDYSSMGAKILNNEIPIIAVGGVENKKTFQTKIDLGASLVQLYSGLVFHGPKVISSILK